MKHLHKIATMTTAAVMGATLLTAASALAAPITTNDLQLGTIGANAGLGTATFAETTGSLIRVALSLLGLVAIVLVIYGGFKWMTAGGSEENVESAKKILYSGVIGIVIILSAYALTTFILGSLITATTGGA